MKIWVVEIGEPLPVEENVRLHRYGVFTKYLAQKGVDITWWTSTFSHAPKKNFKNQNCRENIDGVNINFIYGKGYRKNISFARIFHQRTFAKNFLKSAKNEPRPDLIICNLPTIENLRAVYTYSKQNNVPYIIDVRDAWPDELIDLFPSILKPMVKLLFLGTFLKMKTVFKNSMGVMGSSGNILDYGLNFTGRKKNENDHLFYHGYSSQKPNQAELAKANQFWDKLGIKKEIFTACFFGTIGKFFNFDTLIKAAEILEKEYEIQIVICGDGSQLKECQHKAKNIKSLFFPGWVDFPKIWALMERSDFGIAPYVSDSNMSFPNKPFEYFAGGLPIISSIQGELKEILETNKCGYTYYDTDVEKLCEIFRKVIVNKEETAAMSKRARKLFEDNYTHEKVFESAYSYLKTIIAKIKGK
ncbi:glycosyltransferase family 4 protein [Candidatus Margulisiibacteriota bacterium]